MRISSSSPFLVDSVFLHSMRPLQSDHHEKMRLISLTNSTSASRWKKEHHHHHNFRGRQRVVSFTDRQVLFTVTSHTCCLTVALVVLCQTLLCSSIKIYLTGRVEMLPESVGRKFRAGNGLKVEIFMGKLSEIVALNDKQWRQWLKKWSTWLKWTVDVVRRRSRRLKRVGWVIIIMIQLESWKGGREDEIKGVGEEMCSLADNLQTMHRIHTRFHFVFQFPLSKFVICVPTCIHRAPFIILSLLHHRSLYTWSENVVQKNLTIFFKESAAVKFFFIRPVKRIIRWPR